jgi:hypothetical protein
VDATREAAGQDSRRDGEPGLRTSAAVPNDSPQRSSRPAHARSGALHWAATAAALAAVVAGAVVAAPAQGAPQPAAGAGASADATRHPAAPAPDPAAVRLPLDCGPFPTKVALRFSADLDGDGGLETVAAAHCDGGNGTPPDGVFVLARGRGGTGGPVVSHTLVRAAEDLTVLALHLRSDGTITAHARGYSNQAVPRCCPDLDLELSWSRQGDGYVRSNAAAPVARA